MVGVLLHRVVKERLGLLELPGRGLQHSELVEDVRGLFFFLAFL